MSKIYNKMPAGWFRLWDFEDKRQAVECYIMYMLMRTQSAFEWRGLPDTIPVRMLEMYLQMNGNACITQIGHDLYAFVGGFGGEPDLYYMPTKYIIANPKLKNTLELDVKRQCVVIPNDAMYIGLLPLFRRYATALAENDITMRLLNINMRATALISAGDDRTARGAEKFLKDLEDGKQGVIAENFFLEGIKIQPYAGMNGSRITDLIELQQYLKGGWFNEIGLQANYNMKREALNSSETQLNEDALLPLIDNMLTQRQEGAEKVNKMYGTRISVEFASSWKNNEIKNEQGRDDDKLR